MREIAGRLLAWGPLGVFVLAVLDSAGIPLPGGVDVLLISTSAAHPRSAYAAAMFAVAGSAIGCLVLYYLARKGGEAYLERHSLSPRARRFRRWFQHYGLLTVFIPALVPIPLPVKIFVLSAGALGVSVRWFMIVILAARVPRYIALAYLGRKLGEHSLKYLRDYVWHLTAIAVALGIVLYMLVRIAEWRRPATAR